MSILCMSYEFEDFSKFLKELADPSSPKYEASWRLFDQEFTPKIIRQVEGITHNRQYIEDIVGKLLELLLADDFKIIKGIRMPNEKSFGFYLMVTAKRLAINYVNRKKPFVPLNPEEQMGSENLLPTQRMETDRNYYEGLHKSFVQLARSVFTSSKDKNNVERKILITMLRYVAEFPSKAVAPILLLGLSGDHNVDVTVERFCKRIREKSVTVRDLEENWLFIDKQLISPKNKNKNENHQNAKKESQSDIHLLPGSMLAFAQFGLDGHVEAAKHIDECTHCGKLYKFIYEFFENGALSDFEPAPKCPTTDKETSIYMARFLNDRVEQGMAASYYKHLNDCYSCFELFCVNWSSYLWVLESDDNMENGDA